jgi:hypothetical protein
MKFAYDLTGAAPLKRAIPLFGNATNIKAGAAVMRGSTPATNQGYGIVAASSINNFMGVTEALFAAATLDNDPSGGTKYILTDVNINPFAVYEAEYDQTTGLTIASVDGSGNPTVTNLEAIDGGWFLIIGAPVKGWLAYIKSVSAGAITPKTTNAGITTASKLMKILPLYADELDLTTDATAILSTTAAEGSGLARVYENKIVATGFDHQFLDPTKHDGITLASGFKAFALINFTAPIAINDN